MCHARRPNRALSNVINALNEAAALAGDSLRYMLAIHASNEPQANRLNDGLPQALSTIGANRVIFSSTQFRTFSAYVLVGQPLVGEGNGIEAYKGTTDNATDAVAKVIVVFFEIVDVEDEQRDGEEFGSRAIDDAREEMLEVARVVQAGQLVGDGELLETVVPLLEAVQFADQIGQMRQQMSRCVCILILGEHQVQLPQFLFIDFH